MHMAEDDAEDLSRPWRMRTTCSTTPPRTSCGFATACASSPARMWNTSAVYIHWHQSGPSLMVDEQLVRLLDSASLLVWDFRSGASVAQSPWNRDYLTARIKAVQQSGHRAPMHRNELTWCLKIHAECASRLGGVSLEFTSELNDDGFSVT
ncbi:hypothetical protein GGX14DRAFT_609763 [Mycena pura]|uniref:Uncharacterized protein n=1 Tax=Mycena pura TaxID=153505 RepID=A0AAD6VJQ4_9AGAR|nr:hypothetical protein GGX14DRAFT_609763 [Mycena pura]